MTEWLSIDQFLSSGCLRADTVERNAGVSGDKDEPFGLCLGDQEPIERVPVVGRKISCLFRVMKGQWQIREPLFFNDG